jgi:hypothetical protein
VPKIARRLVISGSDTSRCASGSSLRTDGHGGAFGPMASCWRLNTTVGSRSRPARYVNSARASASVLRTSSSGMPCAYHTAVMTAPSSGCSTSVAVRSGNASATTRSTSGSVRSIDSKSASRQLISCSRSM